MTEVRSLFGGPVAGLREVNERALQEAEALLEAVRSGEVVGFAIARLHHDHLSSWRVAGIVGGYGMIGALEHAKASVMAVNDDDA